MTNPVNLSSRMTSVVTKVMPMVATTLAERTSNGPPKIDLATAENWLLREELVEIFKEAVAQDLDCKSLSYPAGFGGDPQLLDSLAAFFNKHLKPIIPVEADQIAITNGASSCLDQLIYSICDSGDSVLVPAPYWNGFDIHLTLRTQVRIVPVYTPTLESTLCPLFIDALEEAYNNHEASEKIKALVLTNPHNPLGRCYPVDVVRDAMRWCSAKKIHFVSDEVYGIAEFKSECPRRTDYRTALGLVGCVETNAQEAGQDGYHENKGLPKENEPPDEHLTSNVHINKASNKSKLAFRSENKHFSYKKELSARLDYTLDPHIDLSLIHVIWSMSKDFGCSGLRMATLVSQDNQAVLTAIRLLSAPNLSSPTTLLCKHLFASNRLDVLIETMRVRLARAYAIIEARLLRWKVQFVLATAGVFVWVQLLSNNNSTDQNVTKHQNSDEWEDDLLTRLRSNGVMVGGGKDFHLEAWTEQGWVRIVFAVEEEKLVEGLDRIEQCLGLGRGQESRKRVLEDTDEMVNKSTPCKARVMAQC